MSYTARIQQETTGAWRAVSYHRSEREAVAAASLLAARGWVAAAFAGRQKVSKRP